MGVNSQNYRNISIQNINDNDGAIDEQEAQKAAEEQLAIQNLVQLEEKYHKESRENHHEEDRRRLWEAREALKPKKSHFVKVNDRLTQPLRGGHDVVDQVNKDKISYSKLMSYSLKDTDFIQNFMIEAKRCQTSELLQIPELDIEEYDPKKSIQNLTRQTMCHQQKRIDNEDQIKSRQEIIRERLIQNMKPTLRFDFQGEGRDTKKTVNNQLLKRTRSTNMRNSLSHQTMRDSLKLKNCHSTTALKKPILKQTQSITNNQQYVNSLTDKLRIKKIQTKKQISESEFEPKTSYGRIEQILNQKYGNFDQLQESQKQSYRKQKMLKNSINGLENVQKNSMKTLKTLKKSVTSSKLNADIFTPAKSSSILKNKKDSISLAESINTGHNGSAAQTQTSNFNNKHPVPTLNLQPIPQEVVRQQIQKNDSEIEKRIMGSSVNSPGRFLATITDEEEDTIASKQKASDHLFVQAQGHASKEWYLAASDEEYSIPGDNDHRSNTINTSTHHHAVQHPLFSTRNLGLGHINFDQTQTNAFLTDRNRPTSATSMNNLKFNRPLKINEIEPAYQTSGNFFEQDHDAKTIQSYHSQNSMIVGPHHMKKNSEQVQASKIKIKKIKLPKLKKNKELNNMIKDL